MNRVESTAVTTATSEIRALEILSQAEPVACAWQVAEVTLFAVGTYFNGRAVYDLGGKHRRVGEVPRWQGEASVNDLLELHSGPMT
jgi:hypothetical protein